jgi:hypothetical protein
MTPLASIALLLLPPAAPADAGKVCASKDTVAVLVSPRSVAAGEAFRVLFASETPEEGAAVEVEGPDGPLTLASLRTGGGPPFWWAAGFKAGAKGSYAAKLRRGGEMLGCASFTVGGAKKPPPSGGAVWASKHAWTRGFENLFSAWLEALFAEADEGTTWKSLHEVTQDPGKNLLHDHLGLGEDDAGGKGALKMTPDCADNPFFLRAYFSWKLGLPYGNHRCSRGSAGKPPHCGEYVSNADPVEEGTGQLQAFQGFLKTVMSSVHSATARTTLEDENADLYPLPLERDALRPGTVFADPYGHTLTIVRWIPQTGKKPGVLLAVDAQPDGTIGIKRFWQGNFLFATENVIGEPGFKAFRPIALKKGEPVPLTNKKITASKDYGNFSLQQHGMAPEAFYDAMDRLINPDPLDPVVAYRELHTALHELLLIRVLSVDNGESYMKSTGYKVVPMPSGADIFQTSGPWEDYSTPSRDMRLLIAMDVLLDFPARVERVPEAFEIPEGKTVKAVVKALGALHEKWCKTFSIAYVKSDGTSRTLTLADILDRMEAFEAAYNPNDCIEVRWGAPEGSPEMAACKRRAPADQQKKMEAYRAWFHDRVRPVQEP